MNTYNHQQDASPRVSVLMPVYNAGRYVGEAIECMIAQSFADFECICVDDGSSDDSLDVLQLYADRDARIRVISRENTGICGALNDGLAAARGEYVARMDADDWCDPQRFAKQIAYLDANPDCVAVGTWVKRTDPYGSPVGTQEPPTDHDVIDAGLLGGDASLLIHATLMMRRQTLEQIGGWRSQYDWVEDLDLFLRLAEQGRVTNLPEYLYTYRRHAASVCYQHFAVMRERLKDVVREAYERRGQMDAMPDLSSLRSELQVGHTTAELYRNWACHAIHHGAAQIARRHAWRAVGYAPFSLKSWRVMYWALSA